MKLPQLKIGDKVAKIPIIQGGMAMRLTTGKLAATVANQGGIGLIAASGMTNEELRYEIRLARHLSKGIIGINIMVAAKKFNEIVTTAIDEGIDLVVAGAGFSRDMFGLGKESGTPIVPIVSTAKLAQISQRLGAAAVVVEGYEAGGHLGTDQPTKEIIPEIVKSVSIPVIAAGGVRNGADIAYYLKQGVSGVQMGSRFACSLESNGAPLLKELYMLSKPEDVVIIHSPVGLPGRALRNPFAERILSGPAHPDKCVVCLKKCSHYFCISNSLDKTQQGNIENGLVFSGEFLPNIDKILSVEEIFKMLIDEVESIPED